MFIMIGYKEKMQHDGMIPNDVLCPKCRNTLKYELSRKQTWFTFFTLRVFPFSTSYMVHCPYCDYGEFLERNRYYALLRDGTRDKIKVYR